MSLKPIQIPFVYMKPFEALIRHQVVARNYIFSLIWRRYGSKWDILDYWGTIIFFSYYILLKYKGL